MEFGHIKYELGEGERFIILRVGGGGGVWHVGKGD